jgi:hypothetical protein
VSNLETRFWRQRLKEQRWEWKSQSAKSLQEEFTEARILRLVSTKPLKLVDLQQARDIYREISKLRFFMLDAADSQERVENFNIVKGRYLGKTEKPKKGWNRLVWLKEYSKPTSHNIFYSTTSSKIAKIDLLIEDLDNRITQLEEQERLAAEALARSQEASMKFSGVAEDKGLAGALWHALDTTPPTVGYVYLKRWTMPDGSCWFKVGITNNPDRRETEQNVLPVAAETIACVDVGSMDRARAIEATVHQVLEEQRITDANNRELFHLSDQQASAVKAVLKKLE